MEHGAPTITTMGGGWGSDNGGNDNSGGWGNDSSGGDSSGSGWGNDSA
jgi:hypothetical protein